MRNRKREWEKIDAKRLKWAGAVAQPVKPLLCKPEDRLELAPPAASLKLRAATQVGSITQHWGGGDRQAPELTGQLA